MKTANRKYYVMLSAAACALAMSFVDGVIQPGYAVKSVIKVLLFLVVPLIFFFSQGELKQQLKSLFIPKKRDLLVALILGVGAFCLILGGYWLVTRFVDLTDAILKLTAAGGVSPANFGAVSIYIALVNSLLEEFMFRGFAFLSLKRLSGRRFAYIFSASVFALYHFGMVAGGGNPLIWIAAMVGLFIAGVILNFLNEKSGNIVTSWLVHMCANLGINAIGFYVLGMI